MTHQDIAARLDALVPEMQLVINRERARLREACGGIGHVWRHWSCVVCDAPQPGRPSENAQVMPCAQQANLGGLYGANRLR